MNRILLSSFVLQITSEMLTDNAQLSFKVYQLVTALEDVRETLEYERFLRRQAENSVIKQNSRIEGLQLKLARCREALSEAVAQGNNTPGVRLPDDCESHTFKPSFMWTYGGSLGRPSRDG